MEAQTVIGNQRKVRCGWCGKTLLKGEGASRSGKHSGSFYSCRKGEGCNLND